MQTNPTDFFPSDSVARAFGAAFVIVIVKRLSVAVRIERSASHKRNDRNLNGVAARLGENGIDFVVRSTPTHSHAHTRALALGNEVL